MWDLNLVELLCFVFTRMPGEKCRTEAIQVSQCEMQFWWSYCVLYLLACQMRCKFGGVIVPWIYSHTMWDVISVELLCLVLTRMPGEMYFWWRYCVWYLRNFTYLFYIYCYFKCTFLSPGVTGIFSFLCFVYWWIINNYLIWFDLLACQVRCIFGGDIVSGIYSHNMWDANLEELLCLVFTRITCEMQIWRSYCALYLLA